MHKNLEFFQFINNASKTYFNENILVDFYNDNRYKQSFFDDNKILTQLTQKKLMEDLIEISKTFKRQIISKYTKKEKIKDIYKETIEKYKNGITFWLPSSHFYIEKDIENILQTLELYYIVSKLKFLYAIIVVINMMTKMNMLLQKNLDIV